MSLSLRQACQHAIANASLTLARLPEISAMEGASSLLRSVPESPSALKPLDRNSIAQEIAHSLATGSDLTRQQLREAPWCLWETQPALAQNPTLLGAILDRISAATSARPFRSLASAFIAAFSDGQAGQRLVADCLARLSSRWRGVWGDLHDAYGIFDPDDGPNRLAAEVNRRDRSPVEILQGAGLGSMNAEGGYTKAVVRALLKGFADGHEPDHLLRLAKVQRYAMSSTKEPLFNLRGDVVEALLAPLVGQNVAENVQDEFLRIILASYKDPRIKPGLWHDLPHKDIVLGWLSRQSLRQFLDIVDDIALERMWKYRRAFWESTYESFRRAGFSIEAWVAFGTKGATLAQRRFGREASFSKLYSSGKNVEEGHAVLLFRIGEVVIADWSHNGRCNIWSDAGARRVPRLYQLEYGSDNVRINASGNVATKEFFCISHMSSETYNWQDQVAQRLFELTGKRVPRSAYKVQA